MVLSVWAVLNPSSGCFVMTKSVCQHKVIKGGKLQKSWVLSHLCHHCSWVYKCLASFHKHSCPLLHSSVLAQQDCPSSVSDQWHSVAGHRILLYCCHHSLTWGHVLVLLWCWKGLPSGGWWWACWRLGDIPRQCSRCPCDKKSNAMLLFILFSTKENLVFFLCCCFAKAIPSHFTESKDVSPVPVHFVY